MLAGRFPPVSPKEFLLNIPGAIGLLPVDNDIIQRSFDHGNHE
jgi:hypothetical protein